MARSLRDLIDFLLAEIALCGSQGESTAELKLFFSDDDPPLHPPGPRPIRLVWMHHGHRWKYVLAAIDISPGAFPADILSFIDVFYAKSAKNESDRTPVIDRRFQEKVWQWLTRNPEVSVGKNREGNGLTLEEAERRQLGMKDAEEKPINMFVSEERTWLAITGHGPDDTKVLPMEFSLLSIIASHKSSGIAQPELIKLSGQDKRSVPKRTDVLQRKGYIEKRAIQMKATRTSLCTLRKFLSPENVAADVPDSGADAAAKMIDFNAFTNKLFEVLREHKVIARNDLKELLGFNDHWRWRVLSRALRKFERIGVVRRVRALSQYAHTMKKYHPCVMLVREPTEKDIDAFHDFSLHMYSDMEQSGDAGFDDDAEAEDTTEGPSTAGNVGSMEREEDVEVSGRAIPLWSPDRIIHNQLFEVIDRTGTMGCTNFDIIRACFGVLWRRPLENTLTRLVECWQLSQPPYLRHLALVRDTALQRTITHYVHYSATNFSKLVEAGDASWEAVEFVPRNNKLDTIPVPPVDAKPQLDDYGLPLDAPTGDLVKNGDCSLADGIWVVKPRDYKCSSSDPQAIKLEGGSYTIQYGVKGQNIPSPSGRRATPPASPVRLKFEDEAMSNISADVLRAPAPKRPKKSKYNSLDFAGMSEKEKLEAMGMDASWTEYSVLLIERPGPGVYVTSRGRRRPAGKERGRPPASRIAVFKTPKLLDLSWFRKENIGSENGSPVPESSQPRNVDESLLTPTPNSVELLGSQGLGVKRGTKRTSQLRESGPEPDKASKLRRTGDVATGLGTPQEEPGADEVMLEGQTAETGMQEPQTPSHTRSKRKRTPSPEIARQESARAREKDGIATKPSFEQQGTPVTEETGPKRLRQKSPGGGTSNGTEPSAIPMAATNPPEMPGADHGNQRPPASAAQDENMPDASQRAAEMAMNNKPAVKGPLEESRVPPQRTVNSGSSASNAGATSIPPSTPGVYRTETPGSHISQTPETPASHVIRPKLLDKGGSVAFLRRKIVMDLVEKAGGAFPMGPELWYPFVTVWMKTKYKEKPDMRTLRTAVKHLVDTGKLRQQTFCGKDSKGVMVTKTLICKSEIGPDDPIVKDMQQKFLASTTRHFFPPNIEVDPSLSKHRGTTPKTVKQYTVPVEPTVTVKLHQKPAAVAALEKRRGENIQKRLLRRLEIEQMRESMQEVRPSGAVRLFSIPRPDGLTPSIHSIPGSQASFGVFDMGGASMRRPPTGGIGPRRLKPFSFPISLMGPYAMLMSPSQTFNPLNGTFSTNAGLATITRGRPRARPSPAMWMLMCPSQSFNPRNGTFSTNAGLAAPRPTYPRTPHRLDPHLPHSLDDLFVQAGRRKVGMAGEPDPRSRKFIRDTNAILRWELQNERLLQQQRSEDLHYINQTIHDSDTFESAPIEGGIQFIPGVTPDSSARRRRRPRRERRSGDFIYEEHPPFPPRPASPKLMNELPMDHYNYPIGPSAPQQRRVEKLNDMITTGAESSALQSRPLARRTRVTGSVSLSMYQNLMMAIVVVRALAGGADGRMVDWILVGCCFPEEDPKVVQDRGKALLAKNRLQIAKMQGDFQERFIEAYAKDEVPPINYDDLEEYDWNSVIEWANANLDAPKSHTTPDLPATRDQFNDIFELREEPLMSMDEYYQTHSVTLNRKKLILSNVAFAEPLPSKASKQRLNRHMELSQFETVKTFVRANILTPAEVYRAADAKAALEYIDHNILSNALQALVTERVISQSNKGRILPGRNYDITEHFIYTLSKRRAIESTELRRASKFKTDTLDSAFTSQGVYSVPFNAEDGEILAMINLFASGRLTMAPRDPPRDKFGLTEGGYLTRMMNKDKLRFPVDLYPVDGKYITGNPVSEKTSAIPPPCPPRFPLNETLSLPEKFPLWFDIHGGFISVLWDLAVSATLSNVVVRPGITAERIAGMIRPTMGAWEVRMVLDWLVEVGVMKKSGSDDGDAESSWFVMDWWWMVLS